MNIIAKERFKEEHYTTSFNGAQKVTSTSDAFVDDFASISKYREARSYTDIAETMNTLWDTDPLMCLKEMCYIRLISRDTKIFDGSIYKNQKGQGLKHEFIERMRWLLKNHRDVFICNCDVFIAIGSWNDIFEIIRKEIASEDCDPSILEVLAELVCIGLTTSNKEHVNLVKKYLPQIKPNNKCTTDRSKINRFIASAIARKLFENTSSSIGEIYKKYRQMKASGEAHSWQQNISRQDYDKIDFNKISGRALMKLSNSKFFEKHNLVEAVTNWINKKSNVNFTGYPYELFQGLKSDNILKNTIANKQFLSLVEKAKNSNISDFIVCLDTSGSMEALIKGTQATSLMVAQSMALYFSYILKGSFSGTFLEFSRDTVIKEWIGDTPSARIKKTGLSGCCNNTDFLSVARLLVKILNDGCKEEEFPSGVICISDGEFDGKRDKFTFSEFRRILREGGFSAKFVDNFKMVLWDIPNTFYSFIKEKEPKFEGLSDCPNSFYMSGLDPSGISFLTGCEDKNGQHSKEAPKTLRELFECAMNQEILSLLTV